MEKLKLGLVLNGYEYVPKGGKLRLVLEKLLPVKGVFDRVADTHRGKEDVYGVYVVCAIVNVTKDFDPNQEGVIHVTTTCSYQIRPKLIYKDKKGYYYKPYGGVIRLNEEEVKMVNKFIKDNKNG